MLKISFGEIKINNQNIGKIDYDSVTTWCDTFASTSPVNHISMIARLLDGTNQPTVPQDVDSQNKLKWILATAKIERPQIFSAIDKALAAWINANCQNHFRKNLSYNRQYFHARCLIAALELPQYIYMRTTTRELNTHPSHYRPNLYKLDETIGSKVLATYERTIAITQDKREFLDLWYNICHTEPKFTPRLKAALTGLARLPLETSKDANTDSLPQETLIGLETWGSLLSNTDDNRKAFEQAWYFLTLSHRRTAFSHEKTLNSLIHNNQDKPFAQ